MLRARIAVFVSGGGTNLQALIDSKELESGEIVLVISDKEDAYALKRAEKVGIKTEIVRKKGRKQSEFEDELCARIAENNIDFIILAGFMCILSEDFTARYPKRIINIHPSLIPSFCGQGFYGLHVHEAALEYGVKVTGATVHYVNEIPDGGEIILQKAVEIKDGDTPELLQKRVMQEAEWKLLPRAAEIVSKKIITEKKGND